MGLTPDQMREACAAAEPLLRWVAQHADRVLYVSVRTGRVEVHDMIGFAVPPPLAARPAGGTAVVPGDLALGETIFTSPGEEVKFCYSRGQPDNVNAWRLGEACSRSALSPGGDYIDAGLSLLKELEARGYGVFRFVKDAPSASQLEPDAPR